MQVDDPRLEGFTQGIEDRGSELRGFVEEEDSAVGQRGSARRERARSSADEGSHGDGMMGGLEGRVCDQTDTSWY